MVATDPRVGAGIRRAYRELFERFALDAGCLWWSRSIALDQPHIRRADLAVIEERLQAQLDGLDSAPDLGWEACAATLDTQRPGETFTAAAVALRRRNDVGMQAVIQTGLASPGAFDGLVSALGWVAEALAAPWIERLLASSDARFQHLGVAACSARRCDPGKMLEVILSRGRGNPHRPLYARALRLAGELRRQDLLPAVRAALDHADPDVAFWANWSAIVLGHRADVERLRPFALRSNRRQDAAIQLALRMLPVAQGRRWIAELAQDPANARAGVQAAGVMGDPQAVAWLIDRMSQPPLARLAGEAFSLITGIALQGDLRTGTPPEAHPLGPGDDPGDDAVALDEDEHLPWPNVQSIAEFWRSRQSGFEPGQRHFLGAAPTAEAARQVLAEGTQRQRRAAALELALLEPAAVLVNTCARNPLTLPPR
jgi:uncharacterized protein (TIGR02270 family)